MKSKSYYKNAINDIITQANVAKTVEELDELSGRLSSFKAQGVKGLDVEIRNAGRKIEDRRSKVKKLRR